MLDNQNGTLSCVWNIVLCKLNVLVSEQSIVWERRRLTNGNKRSATRRMENNLTTGFQVLPRCFEPFISIYVNLKKICIKSDSFCILVEIAYSNPFPGLQTLLFSTITGSPTAPFEGAISGNISHRHRVLPEKKVWFDTFSLRFPWKLVFPHNLVKYRLYRFFDKKNWMNISCFIFIAQWANLV